MEIASNSGISIWNLRKKNSFWFENFPIEATDLNNRGFANGAAGLSHWIIFFYFTLAHIQIQSFDDRVKGEKKLNTLVHLTYTMTVAIDTTTQIFAQLCTKLSSSAIFLAHYQICKDNLN